MTTANARAALRNLLDRAAHLVAQHAAKSVAGFVADYNVTLTEWMVDVWSGAMGEIDFRRAHTALIRSDAEAVYLEGMVEAGLTEAEAAVSLDDADKKKINDWIAAQLEHVNQFARDVLAVRKEFGNDPAKQFAAFERAKLWAAAEDTLGALGRASVGGPRQMVTWRLGQTEQHCETCADLNGQRHRLDWFTSRNYIPRENGSTTLACGGWRCDCGLFSDAGEQVL